MKPLSRLFCALALALSPSVIHAEPWTDPSPPKVHPLKDATAAPPAAFDRLKFHTAPAPLNPGAKTSDWHRFLGPTDDATSPETHLLHQWPAQGPAKVWEVAKGDGYTSPAIQGDRLILFHAEGGKEVLECLHPETGQRYWTQGYPMEYRDRYGFANGPRSSPVIAGDRVLTHGVTSILTCTDLKTGQILWQRDLRAEFHVPQDFFGQGSSPLVQGNKVIVNVGGKGRPVPDDDSEA
ncbi:PQQ-binding-like beta-propeller repeat protein, partial [Verrucomicrobium sp. BvORR106]|uniref:outer membrane protein assembly factor BamB family protein n=1 Tax=Verrucomicrobium sp. BvORR106 TaxID=1403819 RepID=UPI002240FF38